MAQLDAAAVDAPVVETEAAADNQIMSEALYPDDTGDLSEEIAAEGFDPDADDTGAEPLDAAIDPPVSYPAEMKAKFAQLPTDMQASLAQLEAQRNRQVQDVTTRAAEAQRLAQADTARQVAQSQAVHAQQIATIAEAYAPREPQPWEFQDHESYAVARRQFDEASAQHRQLMQHAEELRTEAGEHSRMQEQAMIVQDARRVMVEMPELADQASYRQLVEQLTPIARELGYDDQRIAQAWPSDVLAMKRVAASKADAEKWRALQARKMEGVRAARQLPKVSRPGVASGGGQAPGRSVAQTLYPND